MQNDKNVVIALLRGLGSFLIDHADLAADYVIQAQGGLPEVGVAVPPAPLTPPVIPAGEVLLTINFADSAVPVTAKGRVGGSTTLEDGTVAYALNLTPKDLISVGSKEIFAPVFFVHWEKGVFRLASPLSPLCSTPVSVQLESLTVDQNAVAK